ncbi:aromatic ring-hydroxylating oxygenase subunit alpha [Chachezhania sediminis]|uniref:aromatic ring-hydroxylating oxygenase subunit alpha n=1 Tax=Chachezhania sediminis TaxID=2599291 RepID=UPI00131D57C1|nr:Rieske 2Fe-2S domain-containing protein [Chachezhania sediminis]
MHTDPSLTPEEIRAMVRPDSVHRRAYADPQIFDLEMQRIYGRQWIYLAHESQLKKPGAFFRTRLAQYEVIVTRHTDDKVYVLHNRCPHRGARICMTDSGTSRLLNCPYHAWSFNPDGTLSTVPHRESYPASFDMTDPKYHMERVPHVETYRGFIFATLNPDPRPLLDQIGPMTDIIDNLIDRAPDGEVEIADSSFSLVYKGNWKLHLENAADIFHPTFVHASSVGAARRTPAGKSKMDQDQVRTMLEANGFGKDQWEGIQLKGLANGHTYMTNFYRKGVVAHQAADPVFDRYKAALVAAHGPDKADAVLAVDRFNNIIYPNLVFNAQHQQMRVTVPLSHDTTIIRVHCFRLKGAPDEMFHRAIRFLSTLASPASMIFSDDVEMLERTQAGLDLDPSPWVDFSRGLDTETAGEGGQISGVASEMPMRNQFKAWAALMAGEAA